MRKYILTLLILCSCCLFLTGCINLSNKYIEQQKYGLTVNLPKAAAHKDDKILEIFYPEIASQFAGANFIYRTDTLRYTTDYYNKFFISPLEQIYQNELKFLQAKKLFKYAGSNVAPLPKDFILKTYVSELYADYRDATSPKAVMSIQFILLDSTAIPPKIVIQKTFTKSELLPQKSSDALVSVWSRELESILHQLGSSIEMVSHAHANKLQSVKK